MNHPLNTITANCVSFICNEPELEEFRGEVEKLVMQSMDGLFHTIIGSAKDNKEDHDELTNKGYVIVQDGAFVPGMVNALLCRIALRERRNEFMDFLYKEFDNAINPVLQKEGFWKIEKKEGKLTLYNLVEFVPPKVSLYKRAKVVRLLVTVP